MKTTGLTLYDYSVLPQLTDRAILDDINMLVAEARTLLGEIGNRNNYDPDTYDTLRQALTDAEYASR
jgi:hypothetical protein